MSSKSNNISKSGANVKATQAPEGKETDMETCSLLSNNLTKKDFPFSPIISLVISLAIFIYTLIKSEEAASNTSPTSPKPIILLLVFGFVIIFFSAFINNSETKSARYFQNVIHKSPSWLVKTLVTIEHLLTQPIQKIQCVVLSRWVEYFNYPFNYIVYSGILVVCSIVLVGHLQTAEFKYGPDDLSPGVNLDNINNPKIQVKLNLAMDTKDSNGLNQFLNATYTLSIVGILYAFLTNFLVIKRLDSEDMTIYKNPFPLDPNKPDFMEWGGGAIIAKDDGKRLSDKKRMNWIFKIVSWGIGLTGAIFAINNIYDYNVLVYPKII
jgi:hypothetical protein